MMAPAAPAPLRGTGALLARGSMALQFFRRSLQAGALGALGLGLTACSGLYSGIDYPGDLPDPGQHLLTPWNTSDPPVAFNAFKIAPSACEKVEHHPVTGKLNQEDF